MKCPSCSAELETGARFCGVCGARVPEPPAAKPALGRPAAGAPARPPVAPKADPYIGEVLNNRFTVAAKLGEGGFGAVYRGVQAATGRKVALKLLHPEMTRDDNLVARFRREGLVLCNLRDAHTVTTYDFDQTPDGTLYIAMELLEGKSLHEVFHDEAPIDWRRMLRIAIQMCSSLHEAHGQGIVHRDLKPENIHLEHRPGNAEFVKILDFGIAKVMQGDTAGNQSPQLTATGQTLGTLEYMSPEQLMGKPLDGRSDVYALGVLIYEMITGRLPFPDAKGPAGLITAQLRQVPDPPSAANPAGAIPPGVDRAVLKMLEKDKGNRFQSVEELSGALASVLDAGGQLAAAPATAPPPHAAAPQFAAAGQAQPLAPAAGPISGQPTPGGPPPGGPMSGYPPAPMSGYPPSGPMSGHPADSGPSTLAALEAVRGSRLWLWIALAIVAAGGAIGAILALT